MQKIIDGLVRLFIRWMPDAFAVAIILSIVTFTLSVTVAGYSAENTLRAWGDGFWSLLAFTNQITLTLLLGYVFANTPLVRRALLAVAQMARSPTSAYVLAGTITGVAALFSWALSLVTAGIMARAIAAAGRDRGLKIHYPLLVATSFSGFVVWHQGLSGSIPLTIATPGHFLENQFGLIPLSETVFTPWNGALAIVTILTLPLVMSAIRPSEEQTVTMDQIASDPVAEPISNRERATPAARIEDSRILAWITVAAGLTFVGYQLVRPGGGLNLNTLNLSFLMLGLLFAGTPIRYARIMVDGGRIAVPFLLHYPFYAGISGMMADSGLASLVVELFVSISSARTLPAFGFISAGLLNMFIPSGGGQWAVQGPIMMAAAQSLNADPPRVAMAVALGDQWTNLIQPLALIPVLSIAGLSARQIMGYTFIAVFWSGLLFLAATALF